MASSVPALSCSGMWTAEAHGVKDKAVMSFSQAHQSMFEVVGARLEVMCRGLCFQCLGCGELGLGLIIVTLWPIAHIICRMARTAPKAAASSTECLTRQFKHYRTLHPIVTSRQFQKPCNSTAQLRPHQALRRLRPIWVEGQAAARACAVAFLSLSFHCYNILLFVI